MITLSSTLLAHQRGTRRVPRIRVTAESKRSQLPLFRWTRYYTGSEADSPSAVVMAGDNGLLRARNDASTVYHNRIASPGPLSTYSSWTSLGAIATAGTGVALATGTSESVLVFVSGNLVQYKLSVDNGASWGATQTAVNHGAAVTWVAVRYRANGTDLCVFYSSGGTLYRLRRTSGTFAGAGTAWTNSLASIAGIGVSLDGSDFHLVVTGADASGNKRAYGCAMGDGGLPSNAWSGLNVIADADAASTTSYAGGAIIMPSLEAHIFFAQKETGNVAFNRAFYSHSPTTLGANQAVWLEPEPHEASSAFGLAVAYQSAQGYAWAVTPSGVWFAALNGTTDYSGRLLSASLRTAPTSLRATVVLDDGDFALLIGATPNLIVGCSIRLDLGYATTAGDEYGASIRFAVQRIRHSVNKGRRIVTIIGDGPWEAVGRWAAPVAFQSAAGTLARSSIFSRIAAKAGFVVFAATTSTEWSSGTPAFAYGAGERGDSVLQRLLANVQDHARSDEGAFRVRDLAPADASAYTFGGAGEHPLPTCERIDSAPATNWTRAASAATVRYAQAFSQPEIYAQGGRLNVQRNLDLTSDAIANAAASAMLRRGQLATITATATAPANVGLELFDVVTVNYALLNLANALYRVTGLGLEYQRGELAPARYDSVLELGPR